MREAFDDRPPVTCHPVMTAHQRRSGHDEGVLRVSVTSDRAKTRNRQRDPRAVLHVLGETFWEYASLTVRAELGPVSTERGDEAGKVLLDLYQRISGEQRLVLSLHPLSAVGQGFG